MNERKFCLYSIGFFFITCTFAALQFLAITLPHIDTAVQRTEDLVGDHLMIQSHELIFDHEAVRTVLKQYAGLPAKLDARAAEVTQVKFMLPDGKVTTLGTSAAALHVVDNQMSDLNDTILQAARVGLKQSSVSVDALTNFSLSAAESLSTTADAFRHTAENVKALRLDLEPIITNSNNIVRGFDTQFMDCTSTVYDPATGDTKTKGNPGCLYSRWLAMSGAAIRIEGDASKIADNVQQYVLEFREPPCKDVHGWWHTKHAMCETYHYTVGPIIVGTRVWAAAQ